MHFCLPHDPGSIPSHGGVFQEIFPCLITLSQPVLSQRGRKWLNLLSMASHNLWTLKKGGPLPAKNRQWVKRIDFERLR